MTGTAQWPPPWDGGPGSPTRRRHWPPSGAPSIDQLDWTEKAVKVLLLVLALPFVLALMFTEPSRLFAGAARKQAVA
jgi:hypothetical protein